MSSISKRVAATLAAGSPARLASLLSLLLSLPLALVAGGCARVPQKCPVSGTLIVDGEPADGAYVVFDLIGDAQRKYSPDTARTLKDGAFTAWVREPGEYAITVFWPTLTEQDGDVIEGKDRFAGKYRNVDQPVRKVTIHEGENKLEPITLGDR